jgi:hypothetical protein
MACSGRDLCKLGLKLHLYFTSVSICGQRSHLCALHRSVVLVVLLLSLRGLAWYAAWLMLALCCRASSGTSGQRWRSGLAPSLSALRLPHEVGGQLHDAHSCGNGSCTHCMLDGVRTASILAPAVGQISKSGQAAQAIRALGKVSSQCTIKLFMGTPCCPLWS